MIYTANGSGKLEMTGWMLQLPRARCLELLRKHRSPAAAIEQLKQIHAQMIVSAAFRQGGAVGLLIDRYAGSSAPEGINLASLAFRYHAEAADLFAWNVMIRRSPPHEGLLLYARLRGEGDDRTLTYALGACARSGRLKEGMQIHARIVKIRPPEKLDAAVLTTGVHFYGILRELDCARRLFDEMHSRSAAAWNALMDGCCFCGAAASAAALFKKMLFGVDGARPTERTMVAMLSACSRLGELALGSSAHGYAVKTISLEDDAFVSTELIDMYSKCGCLSSAKKAFAETREKNVLTWTAMTSGLAFHSRGDEATKMLDAMTSSGVSPNAVTFTCLLSACCHAGLVDTGLGLFETMSSRFGVSPGIRHYGCVVDLLARAGMVEEAYRIVRAMPIKPDAVLWRILLCACKVHGRVSLGEEIAGKLMPPENFQEQAGGAATTDCEDYVALSNLYASGEMWEEVWRVREKMRLDGVQNNGGISSVRKIPEHLVGK